jgi:hypothetical protein
MTLYVHLYHGQKRTSPQNVLRLFSEVGEKDVRVRSRKNVHVSKKRVRMSFWTYVHVFPGMRGHANVPTTTAPRQQPPSIRPVCRG